MMRWVLVVMLAAVLAGAAGPNQAPLAETDYAFLPDYLPYVTINVLRNDYDPDGDSLNVVSILLAEGGYAFVLKNNRVLFWWQPGVSSGWLAYVIEDEHGAQAKAEVFVDCCAQIIGPEEEK